MNRNIWMGLVGISPQEGNAELQANEEAYTSVLLFAENEEDYKARVKVFLNQEKFNVLSLEEIFNYSELVEEYDFEEDVEEAAIFLMDTNKPQMTVLHIFDKEN